MRIWLIGLCRAEAGKLTYQSFWIGSPSEERGQVLRALEATREAGLPVVTWSGNSADLPMLRAAASRHGLSTLLRHVETRHVDLFGFLKESIRLPIESFGLKDVAEYFNIERESAISCGLEALLLYKRYRRSKSTATQRRIRGDLVDYNREDLRSLVTVFRRLATLTGPRR